MLDDLRNSSAFIDEEEPACDRVDDFAVGGVKVLPANGCVDRAWPNLVYDASDGLGSDATPSQGHQGSETRVA